MNLNIDYKRKESEIKEVSNSNLTLNYFTFAINFSPKYREEGVKEATERRIIARIQRKIDQALDTNADEIVFENAEMDILKELISKAPYPANLSKYIVLLEDELAKVE